MGFEVLPAIDVSRGRLAAYTPRGPVPVEAFGGDPVAAARSYAGAGARWIHVVDMDIAFVGEVRNLDVVRSVSAIGPAVQASGGIATAGDAQAMLDAGASRVVLGARALGDEASVVDSIGRLGDRLVIGLETDAGRIRSRGSEPVDLPLAETLGWLVAAGAHAFLVTAVAKVGSLEGPDVATVKRVARSGRPVLAAGGIATLADLGSVRRAGAVGAVVGRAALEGGFDLGAALSMR
jgi:phosphoribosylformimino-5-aminoimidazole carboxamide ribonucleotide (ProFAR) isomerase